MPFRTEDENPPEHDELPVSRFPARVVNRRLAPTAPTSRATALASLDSDLDGLRFSLAPTRFSVAKSLERQQPSQYARHCYIHRRAGLLNSCEFASPSFSFTLRHDFRAALRFIHNFPLRDGCENAGHRSVTSQQTARRDQKIVSKSRFDAALAPLYNPAHQTHRFVGRTRFPCRGFPHRWI